MSEDKLKTPEFGKWRNYLWPVHHHELRKLIPMLLIFFFTSLDYNIIRTLKDTLVITAQDSGAEVIPFIKVWAMFPTSILMTYCFTRLSNRFSRETVIYVMFSFFLLFFFVFTFLLYPARDWLHPNTSANALREILPNGFKGLIAMYRNWTFTAFYVISELWGNIVLFVLFWGFANQITLLNEAKRFYGLFGIGINASGIVAGQVSVWLYRESFDPLLPFGSTGWEQSLIMLMLIVLSAGIITLGLFYWLNKQLLQDFLTSESTGQQKAKTKLSVRESFFYLMRSPYLLRLTFIVLAYNLVINLTEVVWKHEVRELYPNPSEYNWYMNEVTTIIGIVATISSLVVSGNSIRHLGWTFTAMLTPIILLITSFAFFCCFMTKELFGQAMLAITGMAPLALAAFFGSCQNVLSRAAKYSVFDESKEVAFVPLPAESKIKGKAAIDGIAARLGKSSGSVIHQGLLLWLSSFAASAPFVACILFGVIALWMLAVRSMGRQFSELTSVKNETPSLKTQSNTATPETPGLLLVAGQKTL